MTEKRQVYSVAELNRKARMALEGALGEVWVEGELSRVTIHSSGHWYFTLKDEAAAVACAMFARDNAAVGFKPADGMKVRLLARPSLYEANGRYQLIAAEMEQAGKGDLQKRFEELKARLAAEGLFDADRKKPLPLLPRKIGVVTSPTGAAIRDIINVLTRRFPNLQILLAPVTVQGPSAAKSIAAAIAYLNKANLARADSALGLDLLIVGRGGGSIEDLWAFNEEVVARAIADSSIPVISAVGHEIDFTIADFVADVRAPTPSAAAELAVREKGELKDQLALYQRRLSQELERRLNDLRLRLNGVARSYVFREPAALAARHRQAIVAMRTRMGDLLRVEHQRGARRLDAARTRLPFLLRSDVRQAHQRVDDLGARARDLAERAARRDRERLRRVRDRLRLLNPLEVLGRGYSLTTRADGTVVRDAGDVEVGEAITTRLAEGKVVSKVSEKG